MYVYTFDRSASLNPVTSTFNVPDGIRQAKCEDNADQLDSSNTNGDTTQHGSCGLKGFCDFFCTAWHIVYLTLLANPLPFRFAATTPGEFAGEVAKSTEVVRRVDATAFQAALNNIDNLCFLHVPRVAFEYLTVSRFDRDLVVVVLEDDERVHSNRHLYYQDEEEDRRERDSHAMTLPDGAAASEERDHEDNAADND